ncbi:BTB domain-containing protein [Mycena venus]|uniref:BTB domain-containing protein n=1 Tax=Mycena venus TaxID=2733690 RepID=A0A8H6YP50_9AGAR|nr:BTB domain-containing protein [Mycena venus]
MTSPTVKSQRIDEGIERGAPITRSDIWHDDGSVVLQVETTQFRVHWGVLRLHSSFFRQMQGLPQPSDQPMVDGCPVIELSDDLVDVQYLLKALYFPTFVAATALPLQAVGALIRLGRKYDFADLLNSAVGRLTFENPTTIEEVDALVALQSGGWYSPTRILGYPGVLFDMLTLARENNITSVLPCAYYRVLLQHTLMQILDGIPRGDGTTASLAAVDQRRCILSLDTIKKVRFDSGYSLGWLQKWDYGTGSDCASPKRCNQARSSQLHSYIGDLWIFRRNIHREQNLFCPACNRHANEATDIGRQKLWADLPQLLDLPPWSELKKNDL